MIQPSMSKELWLKLLISIVFISNSKAFSSSCNSYKDCLSACCKDNVCVESDGETICEMQKTVRDLKRKRSYSYCYGNWDCGYSECCLNNECQDKSYCEWKETCYTNNDCTQGKCCKDGTCQSSWKCLSYIFTTSSPRTKSCTYKDECPYDQCCENNRCQTCPTAARKLEYVKTETIAPVYENKDHGYPDYNKEDNGAAETIAPVYENKDHGYPDYNKEDNGAAETKAPVYENEDYRFRDYNKEDSGLGTAGTAGIVVGVIIFVIMKILLMTYCYSSRRQRYFIIRRRVRCVATVPIVSEDELQREYQNTTRGMPPPYSPIPAQAPNTHNSENGEGCDLLGPPPAYSNEENEVNEASLSSQTISMNATTIEPPENENGPPPENENGEPPAYTQNPPEPATTTTTTAGQTTSTDLTPTNTSSIQIVM